MPNSLGMLDCAAAEAAAIILRLTGQRHAMDQTTISLGYGDRQIDVVVPTRNIAGVIEPRDSLRPVDEASLIRDALAHPIGSRRLCEIARPGQQVVIITSDLTRPCPSDRLLPPVLAELAAAGIPDANITVVAALGLHRAMTRAELATMTGPEVAARVRVLNHDPTHVATVGVTSAGTPVAFFRPVVEADLRVCLGNLEFHYFAGYSGGVKAVFPGCASRETVTANHAMMVRPEAVAGRIEGNPVRADIEEGAALLGVDFILNVITADHGHIVAAVAGDATLAHRRGCEMVAERGAAPIASRADIVIVSAGGYPKDLNLYQAQKALDNAAHAVRDGGSIILIAECREGLGNSVFEAWMRAASEPDDLLCRIQREFVLGGHKAAAIGAVEKRARVRIVSDLPDDTALCCGMTPHSSAQAAMEAALSQAGSGATVLILPQGGSVLPVAP